MTEFEKEKRKIRTAGMVYIAAWVYIVINSIITLSMDVPLYSSLAENLFAMLVYLCMLISIYFIRPRKCIRCREKIAANQLKKMDGFTCPYCGNTDFTDR